MRATTSLFALAAVAPVVLAGPYFTKPITGDKCTAGQPCEIKWQDDGKAPSLAEFGDCYVGLWTGGQQQQTQMQYISPTNCGSTSSVVFTPDPTVGQNSDQYFIKMVSVNCADPNMPQYKATAYSPKFSLDGMTGSFNQTVMQQIAGAADPSASAPAPASSAPASSAPASSAAATSAAASTPRASSASASRTGTAASSTPSNGAGSIAVAGMGVMGATVAAVLAAIF
ncbi:hypothetical protein FRC08_015677 [Ceratobasidium sp. 394]|nr:hypothetical protein FRC08_015677 [Ceratobasidium sp. 394]